MGLSVLSALYFSQARDVRRLREWAGRAPERSGPDVTAAARPAPQRVRRTPTPQRPISRPAASRAVPQQATTIPPGRPQPWYSRLGARSVAIALVGLFVVGGAAAYGVAQRTGGDDSGNANKPRRDRAAIEPGNVTVAVLNGTTVPGLAATLGDQVAAAGFKKGAIDVFSDQQLAGSVVQYAPGRQAEAKAVGRRVGIDQREPVTANSRALAGDATVIVIAGADKAP